MTDPDPADELLGSSPDELHDQAFRRVKKRRDFHTHVFVYVTINLVLWSIWLATGADSGSPVPWAVWPTLGWGVAVLFNAWDVYVRRPISQAEVEREVQRLVHHG